MMLLRLPMRVLLMGLLGWPLGGCVSISREFVAPAPTQYEQAQVVGFKDIRFWGDEIPPYLDKMIARKRQMYLTNDTSRQRIDILALSGGGEDGAYGAGFLKGWSKRGNRPEFAVVTGISTGALIAPFAFLGPQYDEVIKRFYTETRPQHIFSLSPLTALFGGPALGDTSPLRRIIRDEINDGLVAAIARESRRGRMLFIGTTNLDAQRPVTWDIGSIAASGSPHAAKLIGDIILASAAIPGVFPPVSFDVRVAGKPYQELHVDGGVTNQIFIYPPAVDAREIDQQLGVKPQKTFWLIRNTKIDPVYEAAGWGVADIVERSISTMIKYQGRSDLMMLEGLARRDNFDLRLTYVPQNFDTPLKGMFDPVYMKDLYQVGYRAALSDDAWKKQVSGFSARPQENVGHKGIR
jgi:Predicted esterase of the alpha-beta hydrolase superfamily